MRKLASDSRSESRLVFITAVGLLMLVVAIADAKWGIAVLGGVFAAGGGLWSVHALDHGSLRRRIAWLGVQIVALAIGCAIAWAAGLDGWWIAVPVVPAMFLGWLLSSMVLDGWFPAHIEVYVERATAAPDERVSSVFRHAPGDATEIAPASAPTSDDLSGRRRPFLHFVLFAPLLALALTLRTHYAGHATWWWILLAVAVPCAVAYGIVMKRWKKEMVVGG